MEKSAADLWSGSRLGSLCTSPDGGTVPPPATLLTRLDALTRRLAVASSRVGKRIEIDGAGLLAERAPAGATRRRARESITGHSRLLRCADDWVAVTLSRPDDVDLVPALVEWCSDVGDVGDVMADPWPVVERWCAVHEARHVLGRAALLGLAVARVGEEQDARRDGDGLLVTAAPDERPPLGAVSGARVVDLSSLWAGPLCGALLAECGADVVKVESLRRPDAARFGSPALYERLNRRKRRLVVDLTESAGVRELRRLIASADVVIEASRPRALAQFGVEVPTDGACVWVSITAHGYRGAAGERVGFGDDAAAAGGLVTWLDSGPAFVADAVADPLTGLTAATVTLELLAAPGRHHLDAAMSAVAARFADGP